MTKVMLVEDDDNLREIYGARLIAEGYEIISARDGEEALALAIKEKPDLLISDVMMPKISGFDMLDILRSSSETKNIRVIMMTALSQTEDKDRADKLGADRYLVKSQVTLEDVVKVAKEVLGETQQPPEVTNEPVAPLSGVDLSALTASEPTSTTETTTATEPATAAPVAAPVAAPEPVASTPAPVAASPAPEPSTQTPPAVVPEPATAAPVAAPAPEPVASTPDTNIEANHKEKKVIQPLNDLTNTGPDLNALLAQEEAKESGSVIQPNNTQTS